MAISKRAGKKGAAASAAGGGAGAGGPKSKAPPKKGGIVKADWSESMKKPQAGVSDMTLLSKVSNEAIVENLQKRFKNGEIYVSCGAPFRLGGWEVTTITYVTTSMPS